MYPVPTIYCGLKKLTSSKLTPTGSEFSYLSLIMKNCVFMENVNSCFNLTLSNIIVDASIRTAEPHHFSTHLTPS